MKLRLLPLLLCSLAPALGCRPTEPSAPARSGRFEGEVVASWHDDGRHMTLREDYAYIDPQGQRWLAPKGSVVDGASIPRAFWTLIGGPFEGRYRNASVVHDVECVDMKAPWEDVHRMFYEACLCGGVDERMAKILYYAVHHFGPRWQTVTETRVETREDTEGNIVEQEVTEQRVVRFDPPPPTLEEVEQVESLIEEENPELAVIEKIDRETLRRRPRRSPDRARPDGASGRPPTSAERSERPTRNRPEPGAAPEDPNAEDEPGGAVPDRLAPDGERPRRDPGSRPDNGRRGRRPEEQPDEADLPPVTPEERQWAEEQVRRHIEEQVGETRAAEYDVERTRFGFRVFVRYHHLDDEGQPTGDFLGSSTARLSRDGQVLEMVSGM